MEDYIQQMWGGPGHLRFYLQPLIAVVLGIRDGVRDARHGAPAYFFSLFAQPTQRRARLAEAAKNLTIPLVIAFVFDLVFQFVIRHEVRPLAGVGYAALFVALPYVITRSLANRLARGVRGHRPPLHA